MRRQTTKQPRGAAMIAMPRPAMIACKAILLAKTVFMRLVRVVMRYAAVGRMLMVVSVRIDGQCRGGDGTEEMLEFAVPADVGGQPRAADVAVKAINIIGRRHDDVEIVRNHQHAAAGRVAQAGDEAVDLDRARDID